MGMLDVAALSPSQSSLAPAAAAGHLAPPGPQERVEVSLDVVRRGADFVARVFNDLTGALLVVTPPVSDQHVVIELAREMFRTSKLILTPDLDVSWGRA